MKRLSARLAELSELRRLDDRQVDQIAREFGLSRAELFTLCANKASGRLLKQRLAEFGLTEELLAKLHPEVLRDLQRVCGAARRRRAARMISPRTEIPAGTSTVRTPARSMR